MDKKMKNPRLLAFDKRSKWLLISAVALLASACDSGGLRANPSLAKPALAAPAAQQAAWQRPAYPIGPSLAETLRSFPTAQIDAFLASRSASEGIWGVSVMDLNSRQPLYETGGTEPLQPASTAKLLTTAFALDVLGPDTIFSTQVLARSTPDVNGVVQGPLVLLGGGDPNLSSRVFPFRGTTVRGPLSEPFDKLAEALWARGVREIPEGLVADTRRYPTEPRPAGWTEEDSIRWYGAPVSSLSFNDGMVLVTVRPAPRAGQWASASIEPNPRGLIRNAVMTVSRGGSAVRLVDKGGYWELQGQVRARGGARFMMLAQPDPARMAVLAFRDALEKRGILVGGGVEILRRSPGEKVYNSLSYGNYLTLAELRSPPLREAVAVVNKVSQNLHAEMLLREASLAQGGDGSLATASFHLKSWLRERALLTPSCYMDDGCGLSRNNRLPPAALTAVLSYANTAPWGAVWRASLPWGGHDGTLRHRLRSLDGEAEVYAKTGSLRGVQTLAGYIRKADGHDYAFAIMVNGFRVSDAQIKSRIDQLVALLATSRISNQPLPLGEEAETEF